MIMNDKQKNIIDKLNKDNESLNQGHKSMVEYSKGMICIGLFVVCFLIYYLRRIHFFCLDFYHLKSLIRSTQRMIRRRLELVL